MSHTLRIAAQKFIELGLCALPANCEQKRPTVSWKDYQSALPVNIWTAGATAVCIVAGKVSGNLEVIDFDCGGLLFEPWQDLIDDELFSRLVVEQSQRKGIHVIYRCEAEVPGNQKLASRNKQTLIETRGEGGLFLCDPSPGYELMFGSFDQLPLLTSAERDQLIAAARSLNESEVAPIVWQPPSGESDRPGDDYNERGDIREVLRKHGWRHTGNRGENEEWTRPGKAIGTSAHFNGKDFYVFSTSTELEANKSHNKFAVYTQLEHGGDFARASAALRDEGYGQQADCSGVDLSYLLDPSTVRDEDADDDEFCASMVPEGGLLREIYDYYTTSIYRQCPVFALATSIAVCQSLFGRKVESETGMRTNDYHLILAPTTSGKEGTLTAVTTLFTGAGCGQRVLPEKMQSGNGLLSAVRDCQSCIWVCDEFGMMLQSILDKKSRDTNMRAIAGILLSLYGKSGSVYTGSAYAGRKDHVIDQPHLCVLGVSTGYTVFQELSQGQVMDGMLGRISFWSVQNRPKPNRKMRTDKPVELFARMAEWDKWNAGEGNLNSIYTGAARIPWTEEAKQRWEEHEDKIDAKMNSERAIRSALWGRAAARSMKLALTHRIARLSGPAEINPFNLVAIEQQDIDWGIAISNWNTRLACSLIGEQVADTVGASIQKKVLAIVQAATKLTQRQIFRALRSADKGQITSAINELEQEGKVTTWLEQGRGLPSRIVAWGTVTKPDENSGQI